MSSADEFRVLDAVGNSLQMLVLTVGHSETSEDVFGITWQTLQDVTGLRGNDLKRPVAALLERGLIRQGEPVDSSIGRLRGRRRPLHLWATPEGRRVLERVAWEAE